MEVMKDFGVSILVSNVLGAIINPSCIIAQNKFIWACVTVISG